MVKRIVSNALQGRIGHSMKQLTFLMAGALLSFAGSAQVIDSFDSGSDSSWTRFGLASVGIPGTTYSFPADGNGGKAYRMFVKAPPVDDGGPARTFSYKATEYGDFYEAVDVIGWDNSLNQAFGFLFHASNIGLGKTDGYVVNYDPNQVDGGRGQFQINRIHGEGPDTIASGNISLQPGHRYRFTISSIANVLTARVYDLLDLTAPIVSISATDSTYPSGKAGLFVFSRVNAVDYTTSPKGDCDVTFDNFYLGTNAPAQPADPAIWSGVVGAAQVTSLQPPHLASFYQPSGGIRFSANTFSTNLIAKVEIYIDGANLSAGLVLGGTATNRTAVWDHLMADMLYDAQIVLTDGTGRTTTNAFSFNTFSDASLTKSGVKIIEAEDYNYESGFFQNDLAVSGFNSQNQQIRGNGTGYLDLVGTPEIDFHDLSPGPVGGGLSAYRLNDNVGTQAGVDKEIQPGGLINEARRQKYVSDDLPEYEVARIEGGEWLNYTRVFDTNSYMVYLRVASKAMQSVYLDKVTSDRTQANQTTARLGTFLIPNENMITRYQFVPLTDAQGNFITLNLSGTNTLRLAIGGPATNVTQHTMAINYVAFVPVPAPTPLQVLGSTTVNGTYTPVANATVDTVSSTITIPKSGATQFFKLSGGTKTKLLSIKIEGSNVVIKYTLLLGSISAG